MSEQHWTAEENGNYDPPWVIRYDPTPGGKANEDGTVSYSMSAPVLQITEWVGDKGAAAGDVARMLNTQPALLEALKQLVAWQEPTELLAPQLGGLLRSMYAAKDVIAKAEAP